MRNKFMNLILLGCLAPIATLADSPTYKIHLDPTMALTGYANLQVDRAISEDLSIGAMIWHLDRDSWGAFINNDETSVGVRIDWFEEGVFERGWHSNAMVKVDFQNSQYARSRLKLTQTYQIERAGIFVNLGIGAQFITESGGVEESPYDGFQSWLLPSWEFSVGRAF